jgi:PAS domain-containing protein
MIAAALFVAIAALRFADPEPADATLVLCVVPIAICAISYGPLGGVLASLVGVALTVAWTLYADAGVGPVGYGARIVAFVVVGVVVGRYATERRALERRLDRAYDVAVDLHCTAGFDGHFQRVNPAGCALLGYSEAELLTRPFLDLVHPEDRERTVRESAQFGKRRGLHGRL